MTRSAVVIGSGTRAAGWATRYLAAGFDVWVDSAAVAELVDGMWPAACRLGLFPGAALERLSIDSSSGRSAAADIVQVVGGAAAPDGARLLATDGTARATEPIHLLPLVELADGPQADQLADFYRSIGMVPCTSDVPEGQRRLLAEAVRDVAGDDPDTIVAVMRALRPSGRGTGAALERHEALRLAAASPAVWSPGAAVDAPLALYRTDVDSEWVDYNGHMTEAAYLTVAGWASDALFRYVGIDEAYRAAGHSLYTVETHIVYLLEMDLHDPLVVDTQILGLDAKRVHLVHLLRHGSAGSLVATCEQMLVHVDMVAGRSADILPTVAAALAAIAESHADLPVPTQVGRVMRIPSRTPAEPV